MAIEPLYSLEVACELVPCTYSWLTVILSRYKERFGEPRYHHENGQRMLTESEILEIRNIVVNGSGKTKHRQTILASQFFPMRNYNKKWQPQKYPFPIHE